MITVTPGKDIADQAVRILSRIEATLGELHYFYKFGRYSDTFFQKPYYLFSRCAHFLFSLWLLEADGQAHIFSDDSRLGRITGQLGFDTLRYSEYKRRMLHVDSPQEYLRNEPAWFKFWMKALDLLDGPTTSQAKIFPQLLLQHTTQNSVTKGKQSEKNKQKLSDILRSREAGHLIFRSTWVLEDMVSAVTAYVLALDPCEHAIARVQVLIGLLQRLRQTIVLESLVKGPYAISSDRTWGLPSALTRFYHKHVLGSLAVAPTDEGGVINCIYTWKAGRRQKSRRWTQDVSQLAHPYEQMLFKTWSYHTGQYLGNTADSIREKACWAIDDLEANHLETICQQTDPIMEQLASERICEVFAKSVASVLEHGRNRWESGELPWTYVRELDQLMNRLEFVCREAKVIGGENPVAAVVSKLWPRPVSPEDGGNSGWPTQLPGLENGKQSLPALSDQARRRQGGAAGQHTINGSKRANRSRNSSEPEKKDSVPTAGGWHSRLLPEDCVAPGQEQDTPTAAEGIRRVEESQTTRKVPHKQNLSAPGCERDTISETVRSMELNPPEPQRHAPVADPFQVSATDQDRDQDQPTDIAGQEAAEAKASAQEEPHTSQEGAAVSAGAQEWQKTGSHAGVEETKLQQSYGAAVAEGCTTQDEDEERRRVNKVKPLVRRHRQKNKGQKSGQRTRKVKSTNRRDAETKKLSRQTGSKDILSIEKDKRPDVRTTAKNITQQEARQLVLEVLSKHHGLREGRINYEPLSAKCLQQTLQLSRSRVQRAMGDIFGKKPFSAYKAQCTARDISSILIDLTKNQEAAIRTDNRA